MVPCICTLGVKVNRHNTYFRKMIHLPLGQFLDVVRVLFINGESLMRQLFMENSFTPASYNYAFLLQSAQYMLNYLTALSMHENLQ